MSPQRCRAVLVLAAGATLLLAGVPAHAACSLGKLATLKVTVEDNRPIIEGTIDGQPVRALVATAVAQTFIVPASADRLGLRRRTLDGVKVIGLDGKRDAQVVKVRELSFGSLKSKDIDVLVTGSNDKRDVDVLLGQDSLARFDVEYDLAHGVINLLVPQDCDDANLAYWSPNAVRVPIGSPNAGIQRIGKAHITLETQVNGEAMRTILNSASPVSTITMGGARQAGVTPDSPGVLTLAPRTMSGKHEAIDQWSATFDSVAIGGETIRNAKLVMTDLYRYMRWETDDLLSQLVLGGDFLQAHRVLVATSQRMMYFTHNGGPVFQVRYQSPDEGVDDQGGGAPSAP